MDKFDLDIHPKICADIIAKHGRITDEELLKLQELGGSFYFLRNEQMTQTANFRASIELLLAIRRFDNASAALINTTNALTTKILWLTGFGILLAAGSLLLSAIALFK